MTEDVIEITADDVIDGANNGDDVEVSMKLLIEPESQLNLRRLGDKPYVLVELIVGEDESLTVSTVAGGRVFGLEGVRDLVGLVNNFLENGVVEEQPFVPVAE